jgi:hypothetical protein
LTGIYKNPLKIPHFSPFSGVVFGIAKIYFQPTRHFPAIVNFSPCFIQLGSGFDREKFRAVFTSRGLAAREETELEDDTLLETINEVGGVAINLYSEVAFHGKAGGPNVVVVGLAPSPIR